MALSNIFNEPRREITESVVGMVAFFGVGGPLVWADYLFASWLCQGCDTENRAAYMFLGMLLGLGAGMSIVVLLVAIHAIGEAACEALDDRGIRLRPVVRRGRT